MADPKLFGVDEFEYALATGNDAFKKLVASPTAAEAEKRLASLGEAELRSVALSLVWRERQTASESWDDFSAWQKAGGYLDPRLIDGHKPPL